MPSRPPRNGKPTPRVRFVYFVQGRLTRLVKIGVADELERRLTALRSQSPDALDLLGFIVCENHGEMERELHEVWRPLRAHGEWFRPDPVLMSWIAECATYTMADYERAILPDIAEVQELVRRGRKARAYHQRQSLPL